MVAPSQHTPHMHLFDEMHNAVKSCLFVSILHILFPKQLHVCMNKRVLEIIKQ